MHNFSASSSFFKNFHSLCTKLLVLMLLCLSSTSFAAKPNDPSYSLQYGPPLIKADKAWENWKPQASVVVAVVSSGIETNHADLVNSLHRDATGNIIGYNAITKTSYASDDNGTGTMEAGIIAAESNNKLGVAGIANWHQQPSFITVGADLPDAGDTLVVNGVTFTFRSSPIFASEIAIGSSATSTANNIANTINANVSASATASASGNMITITTYFGDIANITTTATSAELVVATAPMSITFTLGSDLPDAGDTLIINGITFTFRATPVFATEIPIGGTAAATASNIANTITANSATTSTTASASGNVVMVTANTGSKGVTATSTTTTSELNIANRIRHVFLMPIKVINQLGTGTDADLADGIRWAVDHGADVLSMGLVGSKQFNSTVDSAIQYAWAQGCVVVASVDQDNVGTPGYPANYSNVVSVASVDSTNQLGQFTRYGDWVQVAAPGINVHSTYRWNSYSGGTGNGYAGAHVAAEAALLLTQNTTLSNAEVVNLIRSNVDSYFPSDDGHKISPQGGTININQALLAAGDGQPVLTSVGVTPNKLANGQVGTGTIFLGGPAPAGGVSVTLTPMDSTIVSIPASVLVPEGAKSVNFPVTAKHPSTLSTTLLSAETATRSASALVEVMGPRVMSVTINPSSIAGGSTTTGTVTVDDSPMDLTLSLNSATPSIASVPSSVVVKAGQKTATFQVTTYPVTSGKSVLITASYTQTSQTAVVVVRQLMAQSVTLNPTSVLGGKTSTATVTLNGAAPAGGTLVTLTSANTAAATVPASVQIPAGQTSASFIVTTKTISAITSVKISAKAGGVTVFGTLKVLPLLKSISLSSKSIVGGATSTATVALNGAAPVGGAVVTLTSSNPAAAVPTSITIPAGLTSGKFTVTTTTVSAITSCTIKASQGGTTVQVILTVNP